MTAVEEKPHTAHEAPADTPPDPSLLDALRERWQAEAGRWATIGEIALTESRMAGGSVLGLLAIALSGAVLLLVCWLLLMALVTLGLVALGLGIAAALSIVLGAHLLAALGLGLLARRLLANLRFAHTLNALQRPRAADPDITVPAPPRSPS